MSHAQYKMTTGMVSISDETNRSLCITISYTDREVDVSTVIVRMTGRIDGQVNCRVDRFKMSGGVSTRRLQYNLCKY